MDKRKVYMTAIEWLKSLRCVVLVLLIWNVLITGALLLNVSQKQEEKLNQQICVLEGIPDFEIIEVD